MVGPVAVGARAELEHDDVSGLDPPVPMQEVLPSRRRLRARPDRGVSADRADAVVAVAAGDDCRLDGGGDLRLGPPGHRLFLERVEAELRDLVRPPEPVDVGFGLHEPDRLESRGDVDQLIRRQGRPKERLRAGRDRVRLAVEARRRDGLEAPLEADGASGEAVRGRELAEDARDRYRRGLAVEADGREAAEVAVPPSRDLGLLVLRSEEGRLAVSRDDDDPEPADLRPVAGRENDVLREPEDDGVDAQLGHRPLELLDPVHAAPSPAGSGAGGLAPSST
jgi:hypothetical protein